MKYDIPAKAQVVANQLSNEVMRNNFIEFAIKFVVVVCSGDFVDLEHAKTKSCESCGGLPFLEREEEGDVITLEVFDKSTMSLHIDS